MLDIVTSGQVYKHYKGKNYTVINIAKHTETEESLVVYEDEHKKVWARPYHMFIDYLEDGTKRFMLLTN